MSEPFTLPPASRVLLTGATGFTGSVLARSLASRGVHVRAIARASSRLDAFAGLPIEWVRGEVFDPAIVTDATKDVQYVVHLAAAYRQAAARDETYRLVHVRSTELLLDAVSRLPDFRRFVHVSTVGVHGHIQNPPADESAPFDPGDSYQVTKAEAERWVSAHAPSMGVPHTIIRPCAIYGPGDTRLLKIFKMAGRGVFIALGTGRTLYHLVHVEDLAAILERAAVHPNAAGESFIAGADVPVHLDDMSRTIGRALGRNVRVVRFPAGPVFLLADLCEAVCRPLGLKPPLYRRRVAFYTKDRAFDTRKLREHLGYACRYTNMEGLAMTARWYAERGWI